MADDALIRNILQNSRRELLDLTTRNRLLNTSRSRTRSSRLEIVDELSDEVFRYLVKDGRTMSFLPRPDAETNTETDADVGSVAEARETSAEEQPQLCQPEDDDSGHNELAARHTDDKLQTLLSSEQLQKRLLKLSYDARTYEEEQGVNILYLAIGFLKWYEDKNSDRERFAPLLLIPVSLDRPSATSRFKIRFTDGDIATNLSLQARIKSDFGIELPEIPEIEELVPSEYCALVRRAVADQPRWEVLENDMVLWFFSFAKFLMFRDLDPESWPGDQALDSKRLIRSLLHDGFAPEPPLCGEHENVDRVLEPRQLVHVLDADSSQAVVIEEASRGRNLVIQGPPGTGKSQTLANLIASAVKAGKTVLFVAEKMAALDVVKSRLQNVGIGDICLELHSNKANKKAVLQELDRTMMLGKPEPADVVGHCAELKRCRDRINRYVELIHSPISPSGLTPYQVLGTLVRLRAAGTRLPDFQLEGCAEWTLGDLQARLDLLDDLVEHVRAIGVPANHPWRGVRLNVVLPMDVDRLLQKLPEIIARLEGLITAGAELAASLNVEQPADANSVSKVARLAQRIAAAPPMDRASMGHAAWSDQPTQIRELVDAGRVYVERREALQGVVVDAAWDLDLAHARRDLAGYGRSWFRFFHRSYRDACATLRGILVGKPPKDLQARLAIVDSLMAGQKARQKVAGSAGDTLGRGAFGARWNGESSDWSALAAIVEWEANCREAKIDPNFGRVMASLAGVPSVSGPLERIRENLKSAIEQVKALFQSLSLDLSVAFEQADVLSIPLTLFVNRMKQWLSCPEELSKWVSYSTRRQRLEQEGVSQLAGEIHAGDTSPGEAVARCEMAFHEEVIRQVFREHPDLAAFQGVTHEQLLERFRQLDSARIDLARYEVASAHHGRLPSVWSDVGEFGVVRQEVQKKRRHLPIRKLLSRAGRAVQAIKPVFMMSPISVAQYLEPGCLDFDLLLIDEASQVQPVDALGAVARANQLVVVGDSKQLPPTRFFSRMLDEDAAEALAEDELNAGDIESILGLCCAQSAPQRMLSWHYRSRHHSLIALSNHAFYDDRLYVVPSPGQAGPGQGLLFDFVEDGVFDRGGSATNRVEARRVAEAVVEHSRKCPTRSLGVGTFSVAQRDAILDELEVLRRADPSVEPFFATAVAEPFFVKNLENIQGDERDTIFISVGYGKDAQGYMAMSFGPLSVDGGERRLNVLITRARDCCHVFSSIRADDIDLNRGRSQGVRSLKAFLRYAESGLLDTGTEHGKDYDSEFERHVAKAIAAAGFETRPQVGVAGFFIDLAVVDPENPGRYVLGIECDGANYHRSRSARDRDRLRQAVLESRGWVIHRIWSTDWFQRPEDELRKAIMAIEGARARSHCRTPEEPPGEPVPEPQLPVILRCETGEGEDQAESACPTEPYEVASFRINTSREIHQLSQTELARILGKIIEIEGPIHRDEIARRVTQLWGLQRTGRRIRDAVDSALKALSCRSFHVLDGEFFASYKRTTCPIRDRADAPSATLRKPEMIPPVEIRGAVTAIVQVHLGTTLDEAVTETARLLGFRMTSPQLRQVIEREVSFLVEQQVLDVRNGKLYVRTAVAGMSGA